VREHAPHPLRPAPSARQVRNTNPFTAVCLFVACPAAVGGSQGPLGPLAEVPPATRACMHATDSVTLRCLSHAGPQSTLRHAQRCHSACLDCNTMKEPPTPTRQHQQHPDGQRAEDLEEAPMAPRRRVRVRVRVRVSVRVCVCVCVFVGLGAC
jgi:hypothetical protein